MKKILVIPDVHGRDFWIEPVKETLENTDAHIIFLGDYHDPYRFEFFDDDNVGINDSSYLDTSYNRFISIIELKKNHPDRITLLLGNHDSGYAIGDAICCSRMDYRHRAGLTVLFRDNREFFRIAHTETINSKKFIFSHAGILKGWAVEVFGEKARDNDFNITDRLNNAWLTKDNNILSLLGMFDIYRGFGAYKYGSGFSAYKYGSPIWSDIKAWRGMTMNDTYGYNIVGHTMLKEDAEPVVFEAIADLDCKKAFYINEEGDIYEYKTDKKLEKTNL